MITCIFSCDLNGVIGVNGTLPWDIPSDLKNFKKETTGKTVIMGRKTFESIGKELPDRRNIIITTHPVKDVECYSSIKEALAKIDGDVYLIGGKGIIEEGFELADRLLITSVPIVVPDYEGPLVKVDMSKKKGFDIVSIDHVENPNEIDYYVMEYRRK
jgi:dihydrofolate reductase